MPQLHNLASTIVVPPPHWDVVWLAGQVVPAGLRFWGGTAEDKWATPDPLKAIRYSRQEDANRALAASYRMEKVYYLYEYAFDPTNREAPLLIQRVPIE